MADFFREIPTFELKFTCNFKGCLDNRPMSVMSAIEHQAFHFCETFKTQVHFNFKCEYCNVYHVNKSHHRLCLNEPTGQGHTSFLRSVFTVPMSDQEFHDCVDFSRFASQHMLAVTAEGVRLVPAGSAGDPMPQYNFEGKPVVADTSTPIFNNKRSSSSYRDIDNNSAGGDNKYNSDNKFYRSGGSFSDRNDSRDYRGRGGRGGFRGRGERGRFFRGGRGRGGGRRDGDDDSGYGGRDNEYRRGRGRGGGSSFRDNGNDSFRSRGIDTQFQKNRSYSRSRSGSPVAAANPSAGFNCSRARSYSRSGSASPPPARSINKEAVATRERSYSRSGSSSPPPAKKQNTETTSRNARSYSRSQSGSPTPKSGSSLAPEERNRPPASYSRSGSSSPRNDENNNNGGDDQENTHPDSFTKNEDYMTDGYGCGRISSRGRMHSTSNTPAFAANDAKCYKGRQSRLDVFNDNQYDSGKSVDRNTKKRRERSYSKSSSSSP